MRAITKLMVRELIGGVFSWIWIVASLGTVYFFVQLVFFDGNWINFVLAMGVGLIGNLLWRAIQKTENNVVPVSIPQTEADIAAAFNRCTFALDIDPKDPQLRHITSALSGLQTAIAPRDYVETFFDGYARDFERSLVGTLQYRAPSVLTQIMLTNSFGKTLGKGLDLGCGTGLAGEALKNYSGSLVGVDLSQAMLEKARNKNIYDLLVHQDIIEFLNSAELDFDYFIAVDVFTYIGDLTALFALIKSRNERSGKLAFSTEHLEDGEYFLAKSGRYSHSKSYIKDLSKTYGYRVSHFENTELRKEEDYFLTGGLYLLEF